MQPEQRFQQVTTIVGGFLMPLGLAVIGIGWYGAAHTGYVFEQIPYLVSGGLFGLGLTFCGALIFFSSWLARLVALQRRQAELTQRLLDRWSADEATPSDEVRRPPAVRPRTSSGALRQPTQPMSTVDG